jgi:ABC-type glucose/galactose transport system permease subunit
MKKSLIYFVPTALIFLLSVIIATYFMENIFNLMKLAMINFSTILQNSEFKILLCFSVVGIVGMHRSRGNK